MFITPQLAIVAGLAALPAIIWSVVLFRGRKGSRWPLVLAFFIGTLTVIPLMLLENLWIWRPEWDIYAILEQSLANGFVLAVATLVVVGILEELAKSLVVRTIDRSRIPVANINDAVKFSIMAGLGFAFTENIFYFTYFWQTSGLAGLISGLISRSLLTVCAHMVFSGIFGYYYGLAKFSSPILQTELWMGRSHKAISILAKALGVNEAEAFRQWLRLKGLLIAMAVHAVFNTSLEFDQIFPALIVIALGFAFLLYLLAHKTGAIAFEGTARKSTMAKRDEDVVLELLGMWTQEGRYTDVIDICQRLLMRDPDNKVVQLFQAKAMDAQKLQKLEDAATSLFRSEENSQDDKSLRTLVKQKVLMDMLKEKQSAPPQTSPSSPPQSPAPPQPTAPKLPQPQKPPSA